MTCMILQGMLAFGQIGVNTDFPDNSSALEIQSTTRGLLIPRVTLTSDLTSPNPVTSPATGLLVFNSGTNQAIGFYYWDGVHWVALGGGGSSGGDYWSLFGNSGTSPGSNFVGTIDAQDLAIYTNNTERMRVLQDGHVIIGGITPANSTDVLTVYGNATQNTAFSALAPRTGFYSYLGRYGLYSRVDTSNGFGVYSRNFDPAGYGTITMGSNSPYAVLLSHSAGLMSVGNDGIVTLATGITGSGIIAAGSNADTAFYHPSGSGGAFTGYHGAFSRARNASGTGVIGAGNNINPQNLVTGSGGAFTGGTTGMIAWATGSTSTGIIGLGANAASITVSNGSGGVLRGYHGLFARGDNASGFGVIGLGSAGSTFATITNGAGGIFTGYQGVYGYSANASGTGIIGVGNNAGGYNILTTGSGGAFSGTTEGVVGYGTTVATGTGVVGTGNNLVPVTLPAGSGGSFTGTTTGAYGFGQGASATGIVGVGNAVAVPSSFAAGSGGAFNGTVAGVVGWGKNATGTGVIGAGNNIAPQTSGNGSGGAFTGTAAGVVAYGTTAATGIGVIGAGNNVTPSVPAGGCGGSFTGTVGGVYGYTTTTGNNITFGGYFQTGGATSYAYVGYRNGAPWTNYKISGNGSVATIVKNRNGERIALVCPEAPETVFQDFGIGQLVNGQAHITIDPDLAININVSEDHPLKVYITPEGDCNGVYVTNKSADGFDVIELMGGTSNVPFSWQIVATRANEETILSDGSVESTYYDMRFAPAPGPLESINLPIQTNQSDNSTSLQPVQLPTINVKSEMMGTIEQKTETTNSSSAIQTKESPDE